MQQLEAHEYPLYKVFGGDFDFRIPNYQRPYAWGVEETLQLLEDLSDALGRDDEEPYFLGSIVLVKDKGSAEADVIDGQQRLTTLTILLAVLRDLAEGPELRAELDSYVREPGKVARGLEPKPRLRLRQRDAEFFEAHVQTPLATAGLAQLKKDSLGTDAQRAVQENALALRRHLEGWGEDERLRLVQMLSVRTYLVVVSTPDLGSAHRIFSVMNARGLELEPSDIFKSTVIGAVEEDAQPTYADRWEGAEELLGRQRFADLFLHIRLLISKERARRELLKEFPVQVLDRYLPGRAKEFVDDVVVPYAAAYDEMLRRTYTAATGAGRVNAWFTRMSMIDNNDWRPPALWALRHHHDDAAFLDAFLSRLERLAASMFLRREYTTPRVTRYVELLRQLDDGAGLEAPAFELDEAERAETRARLDGEVYLQNKTRKYVLLRLDEVLARDPGVVYSLPIITVEHVLPQTPAADSQWLKDFNEDERAYWTHRLANLVLLNRYKNSEAQNYEFAEKKVKYFSGANGVATFALTSQVLGAQEWTPTHLEVRQRDLVAALSREWDL